MEVYKENVQVYAATYDDIKAFSVPAGDEPDEPEVPAEPVVATVAEFIAAPVSTDVWYQLTGTITKIENGDYGNIRIADETGEVYIYGLTATKVGSNDKSFASLGLKVNDVVTLVTLRGEYNGEPQGGGNTNPAYYISHIEGEEPEPPQHPVPTKATIAEVLAAEVNPDVWYEVTGTIDSLYNTTFGNFYLTDGTDRILVYGLTKEWVAGGSNDKSFSTLGLKEGDILTLAGTRDEYNGEVQIGGTAYYISHEPGEAPAPENPVIEGTAGDGNYNSSIDLTQPSAEGGQNSSSSVFIIDGKEYPAMKIGASKSFGAYSFNLGKTGSCVLTMYAIAWNNGETNVLVKIAGGGTINGAEQVELACAANAGLASNSPFTITFGDKDFYTMNIEGATENTVITVTTEGMQDNRAGFTGVNVK